MERPSGPAAGTQQWRSLLFLHWEVAVDAMRSVVPPALELDLFEGRAFVGLVPFLMRHIRPRWLPKRLAFNFLETNVRTYVTYRGRPGVYFFSLDADSRLAVLAAREIVHRLLAGLFGIGKAIDLFRPEEVALYFIDRFDLAHRISLGLCSRSQACFATGSSSPACASGAAATVSGRSAARIHAGDRLQHERTVLDAEAGGDDEAVAVPLERPADDLFGGRRGEALVEVTDLFGERAFFDDGDHDVSGRQGEGRSAHAGTDRGVAADQT